MLRRPFQFILGSKRFCAELAKHKILWLFLTIVSILSLWDVTHSILFGGTFLIKNFYLLTVSMLKATIITLLYCLICRNWWLKGLYVCFIIIYTFAAIVNFCSFEFYGFGITRKLILIIGQTTVREVLGFIPGFWSNIIQVFKSLTLYVVLGIIVFSFYLVVKFRNRFFLYFVYIGSSLGVLCFLIFILTLTSGRTAHSIFARTVRYTEDVIFWAKQYEELSKSKKSLPSPETAKSDHLAQNVIIVIGESASRSHHSLYGYPLQTTPELDAMRDSLCVFEDVIGSSTSTSGNMERILSFKKDDATNGDGLNYPLLVDFFNEVGYKSFWLSNQERTGQLSNQSGVMTMNASVINYVGADNSEDRLSFKYDGVLIPEYQKALKDTAAFKIIFLHLLGSHTEYSERYPPEFKMFDFEDEQKTFPEKILDDQMARRRADYDNSIIYTDHLLGTVALGVASLSKPSIMIYVSDHGENVYDEGGISGRSARFVCVPFIIYANNAYRKLNPQLIEDMTSSVNKPFSSANMIHMLLTLTGSKYSYYNPTLDVLSPNYIIRPRYVDEIAWMYDNLYEK